MECRSFVFYESYYEKYIAIAEDNPQMAVELLDAIIQNGLFGNYECEEEYEPYIKAMMSEVVIQQSKNKEKYDKKVAANRESTIENDKLRLIAQMYVDGETQDSIAREVGVYQSTISRRLSKIKTDYPELIEEAKMEHDETDTSTKSDYYDSSKKELGF